MALTPPCTTLILDPDTWDVVMDQANNWTAVDAPYAVAQDAASEIKTFSGEVYYDTTRGLPYFGQILGRAPSSELMKSRFTAAAFTVPGVAKVQVFLTGLNPARSAGGQVQVTDINGGFAAVNF